MFTKPISARKLAANRANAQKSTGPRTAEGKARACHNAVKHGLFAHTIVLPQDDDESRVELDALRDRLRREFTPASLLEEWLVERLVASHWRLRRAYRYETQNIYLSRLSVRDNPLRQIAREAGALYTPDLPAQLPDPKQVDTLIRYESMLDRTINRITAQLIRLRASANRPAESLDSPDDPAPDDEKKLQERTHAFEPTEQRTEPVSTDQQMTCDPPAS